MNLVALISLAGSLAASSATATAATVILDANGRLIGATGVSVQGTLYDVSFRDGTCSSLFDGCDRDSDFVFNTMASADAAATALHTQVFEAHSTLDLDPTLTRGCESAGLNYLGQYQANCRALTPVMLTPGNMVATYLAINDLRDSYDMVSTTLLNLGRSQDISGTANATARFNTWAVWQAAGTPPPAGQVPEPAGLALVVAGLALLARSRKR